MTHQSPEDRSLGGLLGSLSRDASTLVRDEVQLAKAETNETLTRMAGALVSMGVAVGIGVAGLVILLQAAAVALTNIWEPWLANVVVGGAAALIALFMAMSAKNRLKPDTLAVPRTRANMQKDRDTVKEHAR